MKVSIVVPIYNVEKYMRECIDSILKQDILNYEIILVDDGSPDNCPAICDEYAARDDRIKVVHKQNGGLSSARNAGIREASGEYLMFMDPDDWFDLDTLECLVEKIEEYNLDVIRFSYIREFADSHVKKQNTFLKDTVYSGEDCFTLLRQTVGLIGDELKHPENLNFLASVCFNAYRRKLILDNKIEFFNIREIGTFEDGFFNIELFKYVKSFLFLDKGFYHYRKTNSQSATSNYRENFSEKQSLLFRKIEDALKDCFTEDMKEALSNRIAIGTMELCLNALKSNKPFPEKLYEMKSVLKDDVHKKAISSLEMKYLPLKWKLYFGFMKLRNAYFVYFLTYAIRKLMRKG